MGLVTNTSSLRVPVVVWTTKRLKSQVFRLWPRPGLGHLSIGGLQVHCQVSPVPFQCHLNLLQNSIMINPTTITQPPTNQLKKTCFSFSISFFLLNELLTGKIFQVVQKFGGLVPLHLCQSSCQFRSIFGFRSLLQHGIFGKLMRSTQFQPHGPEFV